jgi:hypothetical protein
MAWTQRYFLEFDGHEECADAVAASVSSAAMHPSASVLASCSGAKNYPEVYDDPSVDGPSNQTGTSAANPELDNSLKVWALQETLHSKSPDRGDT